MKTIRLIPPLAIVTLLWVTMLVSCNYASHIDASRDTLECDRPGITDTISIHADGSWKVDYRPMWIHTNKLNDTTLAYTIAENRTRRTRVDSIVLRSGSLRKPLTVIEMGVARYVVIDDSTLVFKPEGDERDIKVGTDGCFMHVSVPNFMKFYTLNGNIHLVVRANRTGDREGSIIVTVDSLQRHIRYRQEILPHLRSYMKAVDEARKQQAADIAGQKAPNPQSTTAETPAACRQPSVQTTAKKKGNCRKCGGTGTVMDDYGMGELSCDQCNGTGSYH